MPFLSSRFLLNSKYGTTRYEGQPRGFRDEKGMFSTDNQTVAGSVRDDE
jgi:hypothetical protein